MSRLPLNAPALSVQPDGSLDRLASDLVDRWHGAGPSAAVLGKAARLLPGFRSRHVQIRQDRHLVAEAAWGAMALIWAAVAMLQMALAELVIPNDALLVRAGISGAILLMGLLCLARASCHLHVQAGVMAVVSVVVLVMPAADPALAGWDMKAALIGWGAIAAKAGRLVVDRRIDLAEARLLLRAAGCR